MHYPEHATMSLSVNTATVGPTMTPKDSIHSKSSAMFLFHTETHTSITEEVFSFSLVNHCPKHINFIDRM